MDTATLRASFIKAQLNRAMTDDDLLKWHEATRELNRYLEWWGHSLPEDDRDLIAQQLSQLQLRLKNCDSRRSNSSCIDS